MEKENEKKTKKYIKNLRFCVVLLCFVLFRFVCLFVCLFVFWLFFLVG